MQYHFFVIPLNNASAAVDELNKPSCSDDKMNSELS